MEIKLSRKSNQYSVIRMISNSISMSSKIEYLTSRMRHTNVVVEVQFTIEFYIFKMLTIQILLDVYLHFTLIFSVLFTCWSVFTSFFLNN
jgi:hypothetical protein